MRTLVVLVLGLAFVAGCGEDDEPAGPVDAGPALADLTVTVDADGEGGRAAETRTVQCDEGDESPECRAVAKLTPAVFEPTPRGTACTQQFGGPEKATVTGTFQGRRVDATFSRANGCEIARWKNAAALLGR